MNAFRRFAIPCVALFAPIAAVTVGLFAAELGVTPRAPLKGPEVVLAGMYSIVQGFLLAGMTVLLLPRNWLGRAVALASGFLLYGLFVVYYYENGTYLNASLVIEHAADLQFRESYAVVFSRLSKTGCVVLVAAYMAGFLIAFWKSLADLSFARPLYRWSSAIGLIVLFELLLHLPIQSYEPASWFCASFEKYGVTLPKSIARETGGRFVFFKSAQAEVSKGPLSRPDIFLVMMESYNGMFVEKRVNGSEVTPVLNRLIRKGVYAERFYANSTYTVKGHEAVLLSLYPTLAGSITELYLDKHIYGWPALMRDQGYATLFFQGHYSIDFNDTRLFAEKAGFDDIHAMDSAFVSLSDADHIWGWGLQDDFLFRRVFKYLDEPERSASKPLFVTIATISHHQPFDKLPPDQWSLVPKPSSKYDYFVNSLHAADSYLQVFFDELEKRPRFRDALVILVGDHSYPARGKMAVETGCDEERFRIPFLMIWPGQLRPERLRDHSYSQVDIAPTVMGLLGINVDNHFVGSSIFSSEGRRPSLLVQPYGGRYLIAVEYPHKFVFQQSTERTLCIQLGAGAEETVLSEDEASRNPAFEKLRRSLHLLFVNEYLLAYDKVWPAVKSGPPSGETVGPASPPRAEANRIRREAAGETAGSSGSRR